MEELKDDVNVGLDVPFDRVSDEMNQYPSDLTSEVLVTPGKS